MRRSSQQLKKKAVERGGSLKWSTFTVCRCFFVHCNEFSSADRSRSDTVRMKEDYWPVRLEPGSEARVDP